MIGTATSEQGTSLEQPSEAFSSAVQTENWSLPLPSAPVMPYVALLGRPPSTLEDSGAMPAQPTEPPW